MTEIAALIGQMTIEEKAALCTGAGPWTTAPVARLGIPAMLVTDGPHGVRRVGDLNALGSPSLPATCFPTASALAATWDPDMAYALGQALGEEAVALSVDVLLGPGVNMKRSPLCGRNFEYYAEDPYLAGELGAALVEGVQSKGVGTSLKHYAVNNQETRRFTIDARVDERALREIYLPAFETIVKKAQPWTVMCAYNKVNGTLCSEHHRLLVDILKDEWGFEGLVVSDWGAVRDRVEALKGGLDLEMPGPKARRGQRVVEAVRGGEIDEKVLDEAVRRILTIVLKAAAAPKGGEFDIDAHHALARRIAGEAIVLLTNDGILPLQRSQRIAVIGRAAQEPHFQGGGSSHINPTRVDSPMAELQASAGDAELRYSAGYPAGLERDQALIDEAVQTAGSAQVALIYVALPSAIESEGYDRTGLSLTDQQVALIQAVCAVQPRTVVVLNTGSAVAMDAWIDGPAAVLEAWMMGQAGGGAIADVLFGVTNPSGKLAETFPHRTADTPAFLNFPGECGTVRYGEGLYIGYRYYDARDVPVCFPFGHGLSYTTFGYSNLIASSAEFRDQDGLSVSVDVTNTGTVAGKEIVQLYVHDPQSGLPRPPKELKGFAKVALQPGETKTVTLPLDLRSFAYYHPGYQRWVTESGEVQIMIGASGADIRCQLTVTLQSTVELPCLLDRESTLGDWMKDPRGRAVLEPRLTQMMAQMSAVMGGEGGGDASIGMDTQGFFMETPLLSLLHFQESALPMPPEDLVDGLLAQVHSGEFPPM
jgi:beta-glucosidase